MGLKLIREIKGKNSTVSTYYLLETTCLRVREYDARTVVDIFYSEKTRRVSPLIMNLLKYISVSEDELLPSKDFKTAKQIYFKQGYKINCFEQTQAYSKIMGGVGGAVAGAKAGVILGVLGLIPLALASYNSATIPIFAIPTAIGAVAGAVLGVKSRYRDCDTKYLAQKLLDSKGNKENQIFYTNQMDNLEGIIQIEFQGGTREHLKTVIPHAA